MNEHRTTIILDRDLWRAVQRAAWQEGDRLGRCVSASEYIRMTLRDRMRQDREQTALDLSSSVPE